MTKRVLTGLDLSVVPTFPSQSAEYFFAAPSGASGTPVFRPIVGEDLSQYGSPSVNGSVLQWVTGLNATSWTSTAAILAGGGTMTGAFTLAAGTASLSPLKFTSGTNLTTPVAGVKEYDGTVFYGIPSIATATNSSTVTGRGRIPAVQTYYINSDYTVASGTSTTSTGSIMGGKSFWLEANKVYEVEYYLSTKLVIGSGGSSANSHNLIITLPTSAVGTINVQYQSALTSQTAVATSFNWLTVTATTTSTINSSIAQGTTTYYRYVIKGTVKTGATAGYLLNQLAVTTISGMTHVITTMAGSYSKLTALGASGADINVGPLS